MKPDTRVLLYRLGGNGYVLDYVPTDSAQGGDCSLDRWHETLGTNALDLGFDLTDMPSGLSIFEGCFTSRVGATDVIITAHGTYRNLTEKEAEHFARTTNALANPGLYTHTPESDFADSFLPMDPWLKALVASMESEEPLDIALSHAKKFVN